ncbi:glutamine-hydrolyzing GMP synthase [Candidatus Termititenax persephonae]|uniref:GMP synthase [glutamine-hydrolyzing] n=1 Tax=Candidatus Termititenax persephonae TaxID=2218525 RepID=A0A388TIU0_9BACT|nr:glutamine-hydrolyzing GMP synthase [Candidatus Termititenax persephonae]
MIIILDYGSQYAQLIARRVRECNVYSELVAHDITAARVRELRPEGIILSGGPASVYEQDAPRLDPAILDLGIPILGICYGMQLIMDMLGGKVERRTEKREYGRAALRVDTASALFVGIEDSFTAWMSHGDSCVVLADGFRRIASTDSLEQAAVEQAARKIYGVQFHPEVAHTVKGMDVLKNFIFGICQAQAVWTMANYIETEVKRIRATVGSGRVLLGLSGGVDSTTVAALLHKAVGNQLICMFIDQGFLRQGEARRVADLIAKHMRIRLVQVDAAQRFMERVKGISDPEEKRRRIGNEFVRTFEAEARKIGNFQFLAQGTLYPDVIESAVSGGTQAKTAAKIKTHHNVGGLPADMQFKLLEPLRWLFKDEVRRLGRELGLHEDLVNRHPFPGPGLAIRIIGEITPERVRVLQEADAIVMGEIKAAGWYDKIWQVPVILLPEVRTVGVMGDARTYGMTCAVRCVTSEDAMTARAAHLPWELLEKISARVINEVPEITRVCYDISSKPPATIEWE